MKWRKQGLVYCPDGSLPWSRSHAAVPVCDPLDDRHVAVIFSARDDAQCSRPGRIIVDTETLKVVDVQTEPMMDIGSAGMFDDRGVMPSWLIRDDDRTLMYYIGWNQGVTVPFHNSIGLAEVVDGGRAMRRMFDGPVLARSRHDPVFVASCAVLKEGDVWRMWYLTCLKWFERAGKLAHLYNIQYTESPNGVDWTGPRSVAIDFADDTEYALARPSVLVAGGVYHMWYSYRGDVNRIGYARSDDGVTWTRHDGEAGIEASDEGWDSEMIEYAHVFQMGGRTLMAYNGNGYGASGVGFAELEGELF